MPITRIVISKDGRVIVEGIGYTGKVCLQDLQRLVEALRQFGIDVNIEQQQLKPEAHAVEEREVEEVRS